LDREKEMLDEKRYDETSAGVLILFFLIFEVISLIFTIFLLFLAWPLNNIPEKIESFSQVAVSLGASIFMHLIPILLVLATRLFDKVNSKEMAIMVGVTTITMFWSICLGWNTF